MASGLTAFLRAVALTAWLVALVGAGYFSFRAPAAGDRVNAPIGHLTSHSGGVAYRPDELVIWSEAVPGQELAELDHVATAAGARAVVTLTNGHRLDVGPDTHIVLEKEHAGEESGVNFTVALRRGDLNAVTVANVGGGAPPKGTLTVATRQRSFMLDKPNSSLLLQAERQGAIKVIANQNVRPTVVAVAWPTSVPAGDDDDSVIPSTTSAPALPQPIVQDPAITKSLAPPAAHARTIAKEAPRIESPVDGATLWSPVGGLSGKTLGLTVASPSVAADAARLVVLMSDGTGHLLARIDGHPGGGNQNLILKLSDVIGAASSGFATIHLEPILEPLKPGSGAPVKGKGIRLQVRAVGGRQDGKHYLAAFGGDGAAPAPAGMFLTPPRASTAQGPALEFASSAALARGMSWLAGRPGTTIVADARRSGAKAVYFLQGSQVIATGWAFDAWRGSVPELAKQLQATSAIEADTNSLPRPGVVRLPPSELRPALQKWPAGRFYVLVDGQIKGLSPELILRDDATLSRLAEGALGPFRKPVAVLYQAGVGH